MTSICRRFWDWLSGESQKRRFAQEFGEEFTDMVLRETIRAIRQQFLHTPISPSRDYNEGYLNAVLDMTHFLDPDKTPPPTKHLPE